jgi:hypothetical protein
LKKFAATSLKPSATSKPWKPTDFNSPNGCLVARAKARGMYFCLQGPQALRLTAIWETDCNTILLYGSCGRRMQRTRLIESPTLEA